MITLNYLVDGRIGINSGLGFSEPFNRWEGDEINAGGVITIPKQGVGDRSENFE